MRKLILIALLFVPARAHAQSFEAGVHLASAKWSEFDGNDLGIGGRISWSPAPIIGVEADVTVYPSDFPPDTVVAFSNAYRLEGLFGATIGPRFDRVRPFVKAAAGFLRVENNAAAFACIAIFPPPLACILAGGATLAAYEIGGGIDVSTTSKTFVRIDVADRMLKYPGPSLRSGSTRQDEAFIGHALRFTVGGGVRF